MVLRAVAVTFVGVALATGGAGCKRKSTGGAPKKTECRGHLGKDELYRFQERLEKGENVCPELADPQVDVRASGVSLDGEVLSGSLPAARLARFEPLFEALKSGRETWKMLHPGDTFDARVTVVAAPDVAAVEGASVVTTAVEAGYYGFELRASGVELRFDYVRRARDGSSPLSEVLRAGRAPGGNVRVRFIGRTSPRLGLDETVPLADLGRVLTTECAKGQGPCADEIAIEVGGGSFRELVELAHAVVRAPALASRSIPLAFEMPEPQRAPPDAGPEPPKAPTARIRFGVISAEGPLSSQDIEKVVRSAEPAFRRCYERGLAKHAELQGRISARFVVGRDGTVFNATNGGSDVPDGEVVRCVLLAFGPLRFPKPAGAIVTVASPILFTPR